MHSHNDYHQKQPLKDAMTHRFDSVEADIWLEGSEIMVSHMGFFFTGNLKDLYLDPLQAMVAAKGSVYGDSKPFYLWLDVKDRDPELLNKLHELLERYPMLTTFTDQKTTSAPVTAVLTGNDTQKKAYVEKFAVRKACRDSNHFNITDPKADHRWTWYSIKWSDLFKWRGRLKMDGREQAYLKAVVGYIHEKNRKVRFWDAPETEDFWRVAADARIDAIGTDHIPRLGSFIQALFPGIGVTSGRSPAAVRQP